MRRSVAVLTSSYPSREGDPSGHFVRTHARQLAAEYDVCVLALGRGSPKGDVPVLWSGARAFGWPGMSARLSERPWLAVEALPALFQAWGALRAFDRVVAHWLYPAGLCAAYSGRPTEIWCHGSDVRLLLGRPSLARWVFRALLRRDVSFVFVAHHLLESVLAVLPEERAALTERARVENAPIAVPDRSELPRLPGWERPYALWIGRGGADKEEGLARAIAKDYPLVLIGGEGPSGANVRVVPRLDHRSCLRAIAHARWVLAVSSKEGAPTVVREARALGVPVLARPVGDLARWAAEDPGIVLGDTPSELRAAFVARV